MRSKLGHRRDRNHSEIKAVFEQCGWSVFDSYQLGGGFPDFVAGRGGVNLLIEVKDNLKPPSQRALTKPEVDFHMKWKGQCCVVRDVGEALAVANRFHAAL